MSAASALVDVLGEYVAPRGTSVTHVALTRALGVLGHSPAAVRQAISRSAREGALTSTRRGGGSVVTLHDPARAMLLRGAATLDTAVTDTLIEWDGTWVVFIVRTRGQDQRSRYRLRTSMLLDGLGYLGNGVWVSPRRQFQGEILAALSAEPDVEVTVLTSRVDHPDVRAVVERAWDLDAISRRYDRLLSGFGTRRADTDEQRFTAWTELLHAWRDCVLTEPGLPDEVLRPGWPREDARALMATRMGVWRPAAHAYFEALLSAAPTL
ncbi:PaaX family transcriptional regulator [Nocardia aurantia]|uniref:Transcriptional repressor PaaX n=1 Tax=Nocardia aurantia TaxID=2585199 RepID=A0A7K0DM72_9NOCA|nr:PaaX family transcriptional regulator C-terminal domain-containing protein [Nocardia aurantia]MQY26757.1 Transcriptional repressor PaaX [Nocardia aurantia]